MSDTGVDDICCIGRTSWWLTAVCIVVCDHRIVLWQVENEQSSTPSYWAVVKGAPEVIEGFLAAAPAAYEAAYKVYAAQGGR